MFESFDQKIRSTETERVVAEEITSHLRGLLTDRLSARAVELHGSLARGTATMPVRDIDIACVLPRAFDAKQPDEIFEAMQAALADSTFVKEVVRGDAVLMVRLNEHPRLVDLVPLVTSSESGKQYLYRQREGSDYKKVEHDYRAQQNATEEKDKATHGIFRPTARLFKYWNNRLGKPIPRSYAAECLVWYALKRPADCEDGLRQSFEFATKAILEDVLPDPGNPDDNVLANIPMRLRRRAVVILEEGRRLVEAVKDAPDNDTAMRAFRKLFL